MEFSNGCVLSLKGIHKQPSCAWKRETNHLMRNQVKVWLNKGKQIKTYSLLDSCFMFWFPIWICFLLDCFIFALRHSCNCSSFVCVFLGMQNHTCNVVYISKFGCLVSRLCMYLGLKPLYVSPNVMSPMKPPSNIGLGFSGLGIIVFESFFIVL